MFTFPAIVFALCMGFFMSMTTTFFISLVTSQYSASFYHQWLHLWPIAYPITSLSIAVYRPLAVWISGKIVKKWQARHL